MAPVHPDLNAPRPSRSGLYRDIAAAGLTVVGAAGLDVAAFLFDPLAGFAALSATALASGLALGNHT